MQEYKIIEEIYDAIDEFGLMAVLGRLFGAGTKIKVCFADTACKTEIEQLDLSVRSYNCLKRAGLHTVEKVIDAMADDSLCKIRNLGQNSRAEIRVKIYEFGYKSLGKTGRKLFIKDLLDINKDKYTIVCN